MIEVSRRSLLGCLGAAAFTFAAKRACSRGTVPDLSHLTPAQRTEYDEMRKRVMAALAYERVTVPGKRALAEWEALKTAGKGWPVVIGNDEDLERIADQFSIDDPGVPGAAMDMRTRSPAEILAAAERITFPRDLRRWSGAYQPSDLRAPIGDWPSAMPENSLGLSVAADILSGRYFEEVHILLVPAKFGWEVPAYLRWGGWNACPPPEYHVAALRRWHERYGADLIGLNGDTMNVRASRPPQQRGDALALAIEQYGYCPDIIDQGVGSISALAAGLINEWWYFWWD